MKTIVIATVLLLVMASKLSAQEVELVDRDWINRMSQNNSDTTYIINFWATWCKPCVEELPAFEKINSLYAKQKVKVLLVSCDFRKQLTSRVIPFLKEKNIQSKVLLMNESDPNTWIERVDSKFSGAIPATLIINGSKDFRYFKEGEITYTELESILNPIIR